MKVKMESNRTERNLPGIRLMCNVRDEYGHAVRSHHIFVLTRTCQGGQERYCTFFQDAFDFPVISWYVRYEDDGYKL